MNIVSMLVSLLGSGQVGKIASMLGISPESAKSAIGAAIPSILAGLMKKSGTPEGARDLSQLVDAADERAEFSPETPADAGLMGSLFGSGTLSGLSNAVGSVTGLGGKAGMLLGALTPVVLGFLKKQKSVMGLDASGLASMLASQKDNILGAMPGGLKSALGAVPGMDSLSGAARAVGSTAAAAGRDASRYTGQAVETAAAGASSGLRWLLPVLVIGGLGLLGWALFRNSSAPEIPALPSATSVRNAAEDAAGAVAGAARDAAGAAGAAVDATRDAAGAAVDAARTAAGAVSPEAAPVLGSLQGLFTSLTDSLKGVTDLASAQAALPKLQETLKGLDGLQSSFNALPEAARGPIKTALTSGSEGLQKAMDRVVAIPGVGETLRPVLQQIMDKLTAMGR
jgi:predicted negative regulator of RcsB-dependent stress response